MIDADDKRKRFLERLARAGITEQQWARARGEYAPDLSGLDAPAAHQRLRALQEIGAQLHFAAVPRLQSMLADDAPVVARARRPIVFEVGMFALTVLQRLYRAAGRQADFGPVRVAKAANLVDVEGLAEFALGELTPERRTDVVARAEQDVADLIRPPAEDVKPVLAYRILQLLGRIDSRVEDLDPDTCLTPLQEEIFASQVASERPRPCIRIRTLGADRTVGWVFRDPRGEWVVDVSDHPLGQDAHDDIRWFMDHAPAGATSGDSTVALKALSEFLGKNFTVDILA